MGRGNNLKTRDTSAKHEWTRKKAQRKPAQDLRYFRWKKETVVTYGCKRLRRPCNVLTVDVNPGLSYEGA